MNDDQLSLLSKTIASHAREVAGKEWKDEHRPVHDDGDLVHGPQWSVRDKRRQHDKGPVPEIRRIRDASEQSDESEADELRGKQIARRDFPHGREQNRPTNSAQTKA